MKKHVDYDYNDKVITIVIIIMNMMKAVII